MDGSPKLELAVTVENAENGHVRITVSDTGKGLDTDIIPNLFKPFATTKEQGMGMGLNICQTIIEAHQGRIWTESKPDGGTLFRFQLPTLTNVPQQSLRDL
jgi:two-component system sensor kinase FixL